MSAVKQMWDARYTFKCLNLIFVSCIYTYPLFVISVECMEIIAFVSFCTVCCLCRYLRGVNHMIIFVCNPGHRPSPGP